MKFSGYREGNMHTLFSGSRDVITAIKNTLANEEATKEQLLETLVIAHDHCISVKDFSIEFRPFNDQIIEYRLSKQKEREERELNERKADAMLKKYRAKEA